MRRTRLVSRSAPTVRYTSGPWIGMRDTVTSAAALQSLALAIHNMAPERPEAGSGLLTRPGYGTLAGLSAPGTYCRGMYQFDRRSGARYSVWFYDQKMFVLTDSAFTQVTLSGGAAIAAVNLASATAPFLVHAVTYNDQLVVSDGVNKPWMWDGATFTVLTNAPVAYGRPTVYYAKLFMVKDTERGTLVWSEENDATSGYEAGGYNNAWTLQNTSSGTLGAILGINEGLYYWRSSGGFDAVRGAVSTDFSTSGTEDGIDRHLGSASSAATLHHGGAIWFVDQFGHPQRHLIGTRGVQEPQVWQDGARSWIGTKLASVYPTAAVDTTRLSAAQVVLHPVMDAVLFLLPVVVGHDAPTITGAVYRMLACFSATTGQLVSMWTNLPAADAEDENYFDAHAVGISYNTGAYRLAHGTALPWVHQNPREISAGTAPIPYYVDRFDGAVSYPIRSWVETNSLGEEDTVRLKQFLRVDVLVNEAHVPDVGVSYRTPQTYALSTRLFASTGVVKDDGRLAYGINGYGRVLRVRLFAAPAGGGSVSFDTSGTGVVFSITTNVAYGTPLGVTQLVVEARALSMEPKSR